MIFHDEMLLVTNISKEKNRILNSSAFSLEINQKKNCKMNQSFDYHFFFFQYSTSYPDAISLLTTLLQASHTNALLATTQQSLHHTLPLGSYLLKPVQRILKYHLLLDVSI